MSNNSFTTLYLAACHLLLYSFVFFPVSLVQAGNDALNCKLIIHETAMQIPKKTATDYYLKLSKRNGVAHCMDGRLLQVQMMLSELQKRGKKQLTGFGVVAFESGDTLTMKIRGSESTESAEISRPPISTALDLDVIKGTGQYLNAKGSAAIQSAEGSWSDTWVLKMTLVVHQP